MFSEGFKFSLSINWPIKFNFLSEKKKNAQAYFNLNIWVKDMINPYNCLLKNAKFSVNK